LVNWDALHGQPALAAIRHTGGTVLALTDAQLLSAGGLGWALHGASPSGGAGVAGYALGGHELTNLAGVHVAVLTDRAIARPERTAMEGGRA
jgi:hypothetical protein